MASPNVFETSQIKQMSESEGIILNNKSHLGNGK